MTQPSYEQLRDIVRQMPSSRGTKTARVAATIIPNDDPFVAQLGCCEEASMHSGSVMPGIYVPCNNPASVIIWSPRDKRNYLMCRGCGNHNVKNRGAVLAGGFSSMEALTRANAGGKP